MKRGTRVFLPILMILAMVMSLFGTALPALASQITITKDVTDPFAPNFYYVGDTIYYEMTVENPSGNSANNTLVEIWDTLPDGTVVYFIQEGIDPPLVQEPGDVEYFYITYEVDAADIIWIPALGGWGVKNKFEARGYDSAGDDVYGLVTKNSNVLRPCIDIQKTVDCNDDGEFLDEDYGVAGDIGHWRIVVTNCGEDPLYDIDVWDDLTGYVGYIDVLEAGGWAQFDYDTVVNEDTTNWAYVEGYDALGNAWYDEDDATNYVCFPDIDIQKTVDCNDDGEFLDEDYGVAGDTGHWKVIVTNTGECVLYDVVVWDDLYGLLDIITEFNPGEIFEYNYDTTVDVDTTNVAYVEGFDAAGGYWYDEDSATNYVCQPDIDIEKTVDCNDDGEFLDEDYGVAGDMGHWRIVVTNTGECDLFDVYVWDDNGMSWGPFDLPAGQFVQYDYDMVVNDDTTNWAYVEGYDAAGGVWYDEDGATNYVCFPDIDIEKTVDCNDDGEFLDEDYGVAGDMGHWRIVVTNTGECDLFDVYVWDDNGMSWGPFDLPAGQFVQYDYDMVVNDDTTNWAYVEGYDAAGGVWYDEDDATNYVCFPDIDIQKTVDCNDDGVFLDEDYGTAGDTGHWRIVVTNNGTCDLFDVTVWDTNGMSWGPFDLPAGDYVQYDYDTIVNETTTNWVYVEGYDAAGGIWYDEDDATNVVTGGEGCTPGYWKNNADNWGASAWVGYAPGDSFEAIFGVEVTLRGNGKATYPAPTLREALDANGGGINALARHAVAALLNIANPDIGYGIGSTAALITMVHDAIASGDEAQIEALHMLLAEYNEAGCPINQRGEPIMDGMVF
ncbi:MAG: hypothetical protein OEV57_03450 [Dehalococcoidia bacterium]|nr:hypothetical protein [Dehalococcoidia bacterium]